MISVILATLMTAAAELTGEKEIIFPEIAALLIGGIAAEVQPWKTNRKNMIILMSSSALAGISIVRYLEIPVLFQVILGLVFAAVSLTISKTTMVPMISACILPILMGTETLIYPVSVFLMLVVITGVQWLLEKSGQKEPRKTASEHIELNMKKTASDWGRRVLVFSLLAIIPISLKEYYFIAPPLIVAYTELTNPKLWLRKCPERVVVLMGISAAFGTAGVILLQGRLGLSLTAVTTIVITGILLISSRLKLLFPPAGAAALLPLILQREGLFWYPLKVTAGCLVLTAAAILFFPNKQPEQEKIPQREDS